MCFSSRFLNCYGFCKHLIPQPGASHPRELHLLPARAPNPQRLESNLAPSRSEMQGAGYIRGTQLASVHPMVWNIAYIPRWTINNDNLMTLLIFSYISTPPPHPPPPLNPLDHKYKVLKAIHMLGFYWNPTARSIWMYVNIRAAW